MTPDFIHGAEASAGVIFLVVLLVSVVSQVLEDKRQAKELE